MDATPSAHQPLPLHSSSLRSLRESDASRSSPPPMNMNFTTIREEDGGSIGSSSPSSHSSFSRRNKCARCKKPAMGYDAFVGCATCLRVYHESCTQIDVAMGEEDWNDWRCGHCVRKEKKKASLATNSTPAAPTRLIAVEHSVKLIAPAVDAGLASSNNGAPAEQLTRAEQSQLGVAAHAVGYPTIETRGAVTDAEDTVASGSPMDISSVDSSSVDAPPSKLADGKESCEFSRSENPLSAQQEARPVADHQPNGSIDMNMDPSTVAHPPRLLSPSRWLRDQIERTQFTASDHPTTRDTEEIVPDSHRPSSPVVDPRGQRQQLPPLQIPPPANSIGSPTSAVTAETSVSSASRFPEGWLEYHCRLCNKKIVKPVAGPNTFASGILCIDCRKEQEVKQDSDVVATGSTLPSPMISLLGSGPADAQSLKSLEIQDNGDSQPSSLVQSFPSSGVDAAPAASPSVLTSAPPQRPTEPSRVRQVKRQSAPKPYSVLLNPRNHPKMAERKFQHTDPVYLRTTRRELASSRQDISEQSMPAAAAPALTADSTRELETRPSPGGQSLLTAVVGEENRPPNQPVSGTSLAPTSRLGGTSSGDIQMRTTTSEQTSSLSSSREITPFSRLTVADQLSYTPSQPAVPFDSTSTNSATQLLTESTTTSKVQTPIQEEEQSWLMEPEQSPKVREASAARAIDHDSNKSGSAREEVATSSTGSRLPTRNADFANREADPSTKSASKTPTLAKTTTEGKSIRSVSRNAIKSAPEPEESSARFAESSLRSESKQTSESVLSEVPTESDLLAITDMEMPDAEAGPPEDDFIPTDEQTKPEKPDITWKDLILLTLRRSKDKRMTSNQVADWIEENVPGYRGEEIRGSVAAVLSGYSKSQKRPNAIFDKEQNQNDGPKWIWFPIPDYKNRVDVERIERSFEEAVMRSGRRYHASAESAAHKAASKVKSSETKRQPPAMDPHSPKFRVTPHVARKTGGTKRPAPPSSSSSASEAEPELGESPFTAKKSALITEFFTDSEEEGPPITLRHPVRKAMSNKLPAKRVKVSKDGSPAKPATRSPAKGLSRQKTPSVRSENGTESTERGCFSDLEAKGPQPAPDVSPMPSTMEEYLAEAFGHLEEEEAKRDAVNLPLFKEYDEDPRYGGKVDYSVKDLFAARPDKDPLQNGTFFDREAKMKEIAKRPKRSDLRKYRHEHDGESMPFLRTTRASRDPNNLFVEKGRAGKLWDESDEDEKYANSDEEDRDGDVVMQYDEDGVRKYKNMKELLEMPSDTELGLDKDGKLVFREPETIGANGRVKRSRREWKTDYPKGI